MVKKVKGLKLPSKIVNSEITVIKTIEVPKYLDVLVNLLETLNSLLESAEIFFIELILFIEYIEAKKRSKLRSLLNLLLKKRKLVVLSNKTTVLKKSL